MCAAVLGVRPMPGRTLLQVRAQALDFVGAHIFAEMIEAAAERARNIPADLRGTFAMRPVLHQPLRVGWVRGLATGGDNRISGFDDPADDHMDQFGSHVVSLPGRVWRRSPVEPSLRRQNDLT